MPEKNALKIIVIDDNPAIHEDFIKILTVSDSKNNLQINMENLENQLFGKTQQASKLPKFIIDTASQGQEGVEKIKQAFAEGAPYSLAFVDIRMPPGWDGLETIKHIWEIDDNIQVVICTAYSDYTWEQTVEALGQKDNLLILKKPFDYVAVRQLAFALTKKWQLLQKSKTYTSSLESKIKARTESLRSSLALMRATLESSAEGILVVDQHGIIVDHNKKLIEMLALPSLFAHSKKFDAFIEYLDKNIENPKQFIQKLKHLKNNSDEIMIGTIKYHKNKVYEYYTQPYSLMNNKENMLGRVWSFRDVSKRASLEEALKYQALHDPLTGLPNRVLLLDRLKLSIAMAKRRNTSFAVMFIDFDRFKLINDSFSHDIGDQILSDVTARLSRSVRADDTLARLGGDEFVLIADQLQSEEDANIIAGKLLNMLSSDLVIEGHTIHMPASIGISLFPEDGITVDDLLKNADAAMYHAKALGGNQYQFYKKQLNIANLKRIEKEAELREGIQRNEFFLEFQPQMDFSTNKLVSVEALIRWQHPKKGVLLPIDFIPLAEETGLIVPIGEWILRTACKQNKFWQDEGFTPIQIAVNLSAKQLNQYNLIEMIKKVLEESKLDPKYLMIELSENIIFKNAEQIEAIEKIKELGVKIALDDFGMGFSSINNLRELPVDCIKIDKSYVKNLESNKSNDVIVQAIIELAHNLNLYVMAEGVETKDQFEFLKESQCSGFQGFYFSKPLSSIECESMLRKAK